jgi:hypothetical protein
MRYVCRTGPTWLTKAFQAAGAIPPDVTVSAITKWVELFPNGDPNETRGDGGAALKVTLTLTLTLTRTRTRRVATVARRSR